MNMLLYLLLAPTSALVAEPVAIDKEGPPLLESDTELALGWRTTPWSHEGWERQQVSVDLWTPLGENVRLHMAASAAPFTVEFTPLNTEQPRQDLNFFTENWRGRIQVGADLSWTWGRGFVHLISDRPTGVAGTLGAGVHAVGLEEYFLAESPLDLDGRRVLRLAPQGSAGLTVALGERLRLHTALEVTGTLLPPSQRLPEGLFAPPRTTVWPSGRVTLGRALGG